ncbi:MAG TPA: 50S ribosomal protein L21 [Ktedonobacterales bacterium]|nr:50S ribosomal protein L21 [Ktedonobacterales bacterium]
MYAVIETGGKQYRVSPGQTVEVELLAAEPGAPVALDRVLLVSANGNTLVGTPVVPGAKVVGTIAREGRGRKIIVFKYKSKKRYRRTQGHRQDYTYLTITDIQAEGKSLVSEEERLRYERLALRAAARYQRRVAEQLGVEAIDLLARAEATGDTAAAAAADELEALDGELSIPDADLAGADKPKKTPKAKKK